MGKKRRSRAFKENQQVIDFEEERAKRREKRKQLSRKKKPSAEREASFSNRRAAKRFKRRFFAAVVFIIVIAVAGYSVYNVFSLRARRMKAQEHYAALEKEKKSLERELDLVDSDEYIEEKAREELHMILPGEMIYVLPEKPDSGTDSSIIVTDEVPDTTTDGALVITGSAADTGDGSFLVQIKNIFHDIADKFKNLLKK